MADAMNARVYTVYRVDYERSTREPIGEIVERRKSSRQNDRLGLLQMARRRFACTTDEALHIGVFDD